MSAKGPKEEEEEEVKEDTTLVSKEEFLKYVGHNQVTTKRFRNSIYQIGKKRDEKGNLTGNLDKNDPFICDLEKIMEENNMNRDYYIVNRNKPLRDFNVSLRPFSEKEKDENNKDRKIECDDDECNDDIQLLVYRLHTGEYFLVALNDNKHDYEHGFEIRVSPFVREQEKNL
jgi:hypothetical protein